jgi:hypothetical protein
LLAAKVWLLGFAGNYLIPVSLGPLLIHSGQPSSPDQPNVLQSSVGLLARGRIREAVENVSQGRLAFVPAFALNVLFTAALFNLVLLALGLVGLLRRSRGLLWLLLPILYFTLLTGPVGEARFRAPIEPLLCLFAAVALTRHSSVRLRRLPEDH